MDKATDSSVNSAAEQSVQSSINSARDNSQADSRSQNLKGQLQAIIKANHQNSSLRHQIILKTQPQTSTNSPNNQTNLINKETNKFQLSNKITVRRQEDKNVITIPSNFATEPNLIEFKRPVPIMVEEKEIVGLTSLGTSINLNSLGGVNVVGSQNKEKLIKDSLDTLNQPQISNRESKLQSRKGTNRSDKQLD